MSVQVFQLCEIPLFHQIFTEESGNGYAQDHCNCFFHILHSESSNSGEK